MSKTVPISIELTELPQTSARLRTYCRSHGVLASDGREFNREVGKLVQKGLHLLPEEGIPQDKHERFVHEVSSIEPTGGMFRPTVKVKAKEEIEEYGDQHGPSQSKVAFFSIVLALEDRA